LYNILFRLKAPDGGGCTIAAAEDAEDGAAGHAEASGKGRDGHALALPQADDLLVAAAGAQAPYAARLVVAAEGQDAVEAGGR
jgi:hypothetical protein